MNLFKYMYYCMQNNAFSSEYCSCVVKLFMNILLVAYRHFLYKVVLSWFFPRLYHTLWCLESNRTLLMWFLFDLGWKVTVKSWDPPLPVCQVSLLKILYGIRVGKTLSILLVLAFMWNSVSHDNIQRLFSWYFVSKSIQSKTRWGISSLVTCVNGPGAFPIRLNTSIHWQCFFSRLERQNENIPMIPYSSVACT